MKERMDKIMELQILFKEEEISSYLNARNWPRTFWWWLDRRREELN
jgi:hypothetical protein